MEFCHDIVETEAFRQDVVKLIIFFYVIPLNLLSEMNKTTPLQRMLRLLLTAAMQLRINNNNIGGMLWHKTGTTINMDSCAIDWYVFL